jgi:1-acyl-sn-glycerol-3-phosphate acyltransferase
VIKLSLDLVFFLFRVFFRLFNRIEVEGLEKVPRDGPVIIACNHLSLSDPPALLSHVALIRRVNVMAKKELFTIPVIGYFIKRWGAIPVDRKREGGDLGALRASISVLKKGGLLAIFPEGTRAQGRKLPAKAGVALLAHKAGAPVLTARIFNSDNFAKLGKIRIKFGSLRHFELPKGEEPKQAYLTFSESLLADIFSIK